MSLRGYKPKTKPALWTTMQGGSKPRTLIRQRDKVGDKKGARNASAAVLRTPRRAPRARSKAMEQRMSVYRARRRIFLESNPQCECCVKILAAITDTKEQLPAFQHRNYLAFISGCSSRLRSGRSHAATEIHHTHGRAGRLLVDWRYWVGACHPAHQFITDNPIIARRAGLLAALGDWNHA